MSLVVPSRCCSLGLRIALASLLAGCQSADYSALSTPQTRVQFRCANGEDIEMRFFPLQGVAVLVRAGTTLELHPQPAASGFVYSDGPTTVRGEGRKLTIEAAHMDPICCQARQP